MGTAAIVLPTEVANTAVLVANTDFATLLCPFFGNCDDVLLINSADGTTNFHPEVRTRAESAC